MAPAAVPEVEALRMRPAQVLDAGGELGLRRLEDEVVVVAHQAEGVDPPVVAIDGAAEEAEERESVLVVAHDRRAVDPARRHVEEAVGQSRTKDARHCGDASATLPAGPPRWKNRHSFDTTAASNEAMPEGLTLGLGP
jgi:hypothetical protein